MKRGTRLARYSNLFITFWISGVYHILSDGIEIESGVVRFFIMQAAAITVEDAFQSLYRKNGRPIGRGWSILFSYLWVGFFLVWTSPGWRYPVVAFRFGQRRDNY